MKVISAYILVTLWMMIHVPLLISGDRLLGCPIAFGRQIMSKTKITKCRKKCVPLCENNIKALLIDREKLFCYECEQAADGRLRQKLSANSGGTICQCGLFEGMEQGRACNADVVAPDELATEEEGCHVWCHTRVKVFTSFAQHGHTPKIAFCVTDQHPLYRLSGEKTTGTCYTGQKDAKYGLYRDQHHTYCHCGIPTNLTRDRAADKTIILETMAEESERSTTKLLAAIRRDIAERKISGKVTNTLVLSCNDPWISYRWSRTSMELCWSICQHFCPQSAGMGFFDENHELFCYNRRQESAEFKWKDNHCSCGLKYGSSRTRWLDCDAGFQFNTFDSSSCKRTCHKVYILHYIPYYPSPPVARCFWRDSPPPNSQPLTGGCHESFDEHLEDKLKNPNQCRCGVPLPREMPVPNDKIVMKFFGPTKKKGAKRSVNKHSKVDKLIRNEVYSDLDGNLVKESRVSDFASCMEVEQHVPKHFNYRRNLEACISYCADSCRKTFGHKNSKKQLLCYNRTETVKWKYDQAATCNCYPYYEYKGNLAQSHSSCYKSFKNMKSELDCAQSCGELQALMIVEQYSLPLVLECVNKSVTPIQEIPLSAHCFHSEKVNREGYKIYRSYCQCGILSKKFDNETTRADRNKYSNKRSSSPNTTKDVERMTKIQATSSKDMSCQLRGQARNVSNENADGDAPIFPGPNALEMFPRSMSPVRPHTQAIRNDETREKSTSFGRNKGKRVQPVSSTRNEQTRGKTTTQAQVKDKLTQLTPIAQNEETCNEDQRKKPITLLQNQEARKVPPSLSQCKNKRQQPITRIRNELEQSTAFIRDKCERSTDIPILKEGLQLPSDKHN